MSSKARKSLCPWVTCDKCQSILSQKDVTIHMQNCPPTEESNHGFIKNGVFRCNIEVYKSADLPKNMSKRESDSIVFLSESVMQLCEIPIGEPVIINKNDNLAVKIAWPMTDKTLTSAYLTKTTIELEKLEGSVLIEKLTSCPFIAREVILEEFGKNRLDNITPELKVLIKNYHHDKIILVGNRISISYYGKKIIYKIIKVRSGKSLDDEFQNLSLSEESEKKLVFKINYSTKFTILKDAEQKETKKIRQYTLENIGGYSNLIKDLRDIFNIGLGKYGNMDSFYISKGILLYGVSGAGKSMIAEAFLSELNVHVLNVNVSDIFSKNSKETESLLCSLFDDAFSKAPSVIFIDDIDKLCAKKSISDNGKKIIATLANLLDTMHSYKNVMLLATTSKPDSIESSLRRPGRIDQEFEVPVPTKEVRRAIVEKMLLKMQHSLTSEDVDQIAYETHGFVGADLLRLCSQAGLIAVKKKVHLCNENLSKVIVTIEDMKAAKNVVNPSAMKEVLVDIPNVKWSDIGGQKELKLKLQQSVEWPLKYPESFTRLGIVPPKGVLMFGPPGCSKTMIAKALATESKLNFLNIKGPELFSKWVGESEKSVRDLFRKARQVAPSIIFIDEIDALGTERSSSSNAGSSVQERILTQLLTELDGVTVLGNVTLVAATNRPDRIDKALLRPGRFDRLIYVPLPNEETRMEIFKIKMKANIYPDIDLKELVSLTEGYSGAEIEHVCREAGIKALEEDFFASLITKEHFKMALAAVPPRVNANTLNIYSEFVTKMQ